MAERASLIVNGLDVRLDPKVENLVILRFEEDDDYVDLAFHKTHLPQVADYMLAAARAERPAPLTADMVSPGSVVTPMGHEVSTGDGDTVRLKLQLPWEMPAPVARNLAAALLDSAGSE